MTGNAKKLEEGRAILGHSLGEWLCLWQTRPRRRQTRPCRKIRRCSVCGSDHLGDFVALFVGLIVWVILIEVGLAGGSSTAWIKL